MKQNYKNAFKCKKCPGNNTEEGCPLWWEVILTNEATNQQKVEKACGYQLMPQMLVLTARQAMHTTYAAYDMRNKVVKNIGKVVRAVREQLKLDIPEELEEDIQLIEGEVEKDGTS